MVMQFESRCALQTMHREPPLPHCYTHQNLIVCTDLQQFAPSPRLRKSTPLWLFDRSSATLSYAGPRNTSPLKAAECGHIVLQRHPRLHVDAYSASDSDSDSDTPYLR